MLVRRAVRAGRAVRGVLAVLVLVGTATTATGIHPPPASAAPGAAVSGRVDAGGRGFVDSSGARWYPDTGFTGGVVRTVTVPVAGASDPRIYRTARQGVRAYDLPVPRSGTYRVRLDLAETLATRAGQRVFSVSAGGRTVLADVDVFAAVGRNRAHPVSFSTVVTGTVLHLGFTVRAGASEVSGIEVVRTGDVPRRVYPWHTDVVATTFWVGEVFDPAAPDGSQVVSTYDALWQQHYGGCDGRTTDGVCRTEVRTAANGYYPTAVRPRENPFYLDLPYDDVHDPAAFARRAAVVPWAGDPGYAGRAADPGFSYLKNRWVQLTRAGRTCFGQVEDAGPGQYHDAAYVFGSTDARPVNTRYNGAGTDVSPALNGCLGFADLDGQDDRVSWRFVEAADVPPGPWRTTVTTRGVVE